MYLKESYFQFRFGIYGCRALVCTLDSICAGWNLVFQVSEGCSAPEHFIKGQVPIYMSFQILLQNQEGCPLLSRERPTEQRWSGRLNVLAFIINLSRVLITEDHIASSTTKLGRGLNLIFRICSNLTWRVGSFAL